ncbi:MarR family winged helix-turn-helix transcriptional regulator [Corynebacterium fournieri]|uniref:MarR family winged helix-turn-helix transcriptional regulator n=1 Tax=Corynebacterium fournieri TaxID=1852390 RepID=UPI0025B3F4E2|nr:MarR family transcriptional regulator [Corynebacterium fournieri]WJY98548.1 putative HTH-type transcriptional regulator YusO [Corynebacterium fournieri]
MAAHEDPSAEAMRIAADIRPAMTSLYVAYFRNAQHSDLTGPQLSVLHRLGFNGPTRISKLASEEGVRLPTASNTVNQLEKRDLVRRVRSVDDRRGVSVELTDFGRDELERVGAERTRSLAQMLSALDAEALEKLDALTEVLNDLARAYAAGAPE